MSFFKEFAADFANTENWVFVVRLFLAAFCGAIIGDERSRRQKDAGIRTHVLVALGSCLMMLISKYGFFDVVGIEGLRVQADASRIASQVISGVSFLGAGMIFIKNVSIKGLTTAAGIWVTAALGLAIGAGQYTLGIMSTIMIVILQIALHRFLFKIESTVNEFTVVLVDEADAIEKFREDLHIKNITMQSYKMKRDKKENTITLDVIIKKQKDMHMRDILNEIAQNPNVIMIDM